MAEYLITLSLLIAAVLLIRGIFRKSISPRVRYALWLVVVIRLCLPFSLFEVEVPFADYFAAHEESVTSSVEHPPIPPSDAITVMPSIPQDEPTVTVTPHPIAPSEPDLSISWSDIPSELPEEVIEEAAPIDWRQTMLIVWGSGSVILTLWFIITGSRFHYRLYADRKLYKIIRRTKVYISESAGAPCLAGLIPSIYITPEASRNKSQTLIMIHEYTHMRHGDHIWAVVRILALIVHWWNPLVWAAALISKQDAELACDDAISAKLNDDKRFEYAHILIDTIPQKHRHVVGLGSAPMKERIFMLTKKQKNRIICVVLAVILAVCAIGCSFVGMKEASSENDNIASRLIKEVDQLPMDAESARITASVMLGNPKYYVFEEGLTYYRYNIVDEKYHEYTVTLPAEYADGNIALMCTGAGSGEIRMVIEAVKDSDTIYLDCIFLSDDSSEISSPTSVMILDDSEMETLLQQMQAPIEAEPNHAGPFIGYVADAETPWIDVYTEVDGDYITKIPYDIFDNWPATDRTFEGWTSGWMEGISVYYTKFGDFRWAIIATNDSNLGTGHKNVATSSDGGETWQIGHYYDNYVGTVTGAGFASEKVAFMSMRYFTDYGPEIARTLDGGKTWERLEIEVPDLLREKRMTPLTPHFNGKTGYYPIRCEQNGLADEIVYLTTSDGGMTWDWDIELRLNEFVLPYKGTNEAHYMTAALYGNDGNSGVDCYYDSAQKQYMTVFRPSNGSAYYAVLGMQNSRKRYGNFDSFTTYYVTTKAGHIDEVTEVETITKEVVLQNGKPYIESLDGQYSCRLYSHDNGLMNRSVLIDGGNITVVAYLDGTDLGGTYEGDYTYEVASGTLTANLTYRYHDGMGNIIRSDPEVVSGKLYEYGGFVHFLCEQSETGTLSPDNPLPLTFVPNINGSQDPTPVILDAEFGGEWFLSFSDANRGEAFY